ncbi:MAG: hypothetical protein K0R26_7 [Bacteroidota bacterium]|jgi:hypothetical protein|nr:hypothetical protein [Bacteroidota bacterium]
MDFPAYRKYKNNKHFFKIINDHEFEEIRFIGSKAVIELHVARILPDRNFIYDLLHDVGQTCEMSSSDEYKSYLKNNNE